MLSARLWHVSAWPSLPTIVGRAAIAQRPVATGLGTVCDPGSLLMSQRLLLHTAKITRTAGMAALAPARTVTQTVVVIHRLGRKTGRALVAGIAVHA